MSCSHGQDLCQRVNLAPDWLNNQSGPCQLLTKLLTLSTIHKFPFLVFGRRLPSALDLGIIGHADGLLTVHEASQVGEIQTVLGGRHSRRVEFCLENIDCYLSYKISSHIDNRFLKLFSRYFSNCPNSNLGPSPPSSQYQKGTL